MVNYFVYLYIIITTQLLFKRLTAMKTFINPTTGEKIKASSKEDQKRMIACCWPQVKLPKNDFIKGQNGNIFNN